MALSVLTALDRARTQRYHFKAVLIAGLGFFTDAYDLFAVVPITKLLGRLYYSTEGAKEPGRLPSGVYGALLATGYCGALCGQVFFGWAGDKLGRRRVYGITLMLMVVSSINCGLSFGKTTKGVMTTLCFFRFWQGFGLGGDYPLSATIMSEFSNTKRRGAFVAAVFAMQGFGILTAATVTLILSVILDSVYSRPPFSEQPEGSTAPVADYLWRIVFMFGALPAALTYYYRMRMPETARYTALVLGKEEKATTDIGGILDIRYQGGHRSQDFSIQLEDNNPKPKPFGLFSREFARRHGKELLGAMVCWFCIDVVFYSISIYQKDIFTAIHWLPPPAEMTALEETYKISRAQALIALGATVPGYWVTVFTVDKLGRRPIQLLGFFMMTVFMVVLAVDYSHLKDRNPEWFVVVYALTFFFANFGPNATTFIISAELFPARLRTTCNGIAAAAGKAGAIVGVFGIVRKEGANVTSRSRLVLGLIGFCNVIGFCFTFLLPETKGIPLEVLSGEHGVSDDATRTEDVLLSDYSEPLEAQLIWRPPGENSSGGEHALRRSHSPASAAFGSQKTIQRSSSLQLW